MAEATQVCGKCGHPMKRVDLTGYPFFMHKPKAECLTWWHVDPRHNLTHQAALRD